MRAAILCRKSTDDSDKAHDARSTTHQRDECAALIQKQGWELDEVHVYVEEATSGALFTRAGRPGLFAILDAVKASPPPFDVLVMYAEDRLGRDVVETGYVAKQIIDSGVRIFFANGTERKLGSATDALLMSISNFGAAFERERASARTKSKWFAKVRAGHNMGTVSFGYESVAVNGHKELKINPAEANVVRYLFELAAQGYGVAKIAYKMNVEHPGLRKWSAPGVRKLLSNEIYIGRTVFGRSRWEIKRRAKKKVPVPRDEWQHLDRPDLVIVLDTLWRRVEARKAETFQTYLRGKNGQLQGRPERSALASEYLLSGMLVCGTCRGKMVAWTGGKDRRYRYYFCSVNKSRGAAACSTGRGIKMDKIHQLVVDTFRNDVLTPRRIAEVSRELAEEANSGRGAERREALVAELREAERRLGNLTAALAQGGQGVQAIVEATKQADLLQQGLRAQLDRLEAAQRNLAQARDHAERIEALRGDWVAALEGAPVVARQVLRRPMGHGARRLWVPTTEFSMGLSGAETKGLW